MARFFDEGMKEKLQDVIKIGLILIIAGAVVGLLTHFSEFGALGIWITALATAAIAFYSFMSYQLASKIQSRDDEFRREVKDLYQAIVVSNLVLAQGPVGICSNMEGRIGYFNEYYKGETSIF